jgi:hypothetical protein
MANTFSTNPFLVDTGAALSTTALFAGRVALTGIMARNETINPLTMTLPSTRSTSFYVVEVPANSFVFTPFEDGSWMDGVGTPLLVAGTYFRIYFR